MASEKLPTSLYDFIFIDHARVKSLYAQLFSGLLSEIETLASESNTQGSTMSAGGAPVGSLGSNRAKNLTESHTDRIDPHDLILQDVLSGLHEANFISQDPVNAKPGNFVLLQGAVSIVDFKLYEGFLKIMPEIMEQMIPPTPGKSKQQKRQAIQKQKSEYKKIGTMLNGMANIVPWSLNVIMQDDEITAWGGIIKEHLRDDPGSLMQKHGTTLSGTWYMLAIVDTDNEENATTSTADFPPFISGLMTAVESMREVTGRPESFVGVTPLLIFRKLTQ